MATMNQTDKKYGGSAKPDSSWNVAMRIMMVFVTCCTFLFLCKDIYLYSLASQAAQEINAHSRKVTADMEEHLKEMEWKLKKMR